MSDLNGKTAFVTGGSRGIGAAIARRLAKDGAAVAITYVSGADQAKAAVAAIVGEGGRAIAIRADNQDAVAVRNAVVQAADTLGGLDILVNNAGIFDARPIGDFSIEDYDRSMSINVRAAFVAIQTALDVLPDGGRIISIGSNLAVRAPSPGLSLYTTSKAALTGLTQALARELGPRRITVNIVHPGSTDTDMNPADGPHATNQKALMANTSGFAGPDEIAGIVAYLASDEARSVTGAAWTVDNGANV